MIFFLSLGFVFCQPRTWTEKRKMRLRWWRWWDLPLLTPPRWEHNNWFVLCSQKDKQWVMNHRVPSFCYQIWDEQSAFIQHKPCVPGSTVKSNSRQLTVKLPLIVNVVGASSFWGDVRDLPFFMFFFLTKSLNIFVTHGTGWSNRVLLFFFVFSHFYDAADVHI